MLYRCHITGAGSTSQYEELIKTFLRQSQYEMTSYSDASVHSYVFCGDKNLLKRQIYEDLARITSKRPKWGIITGIRPVKLAGEMYDAYGSMDKVKEIFEREYLLHPEKSRIVCHILKYQREKVGKPKKNSLSLYIGIPFCPTRCLYCSFTSNQAHYSETVRYMDALHKEMEYTFRALKDSPYSVESIYIGGGTPTTLDKKQLEGLLSKISDCHSGGELKEFTVEAGRPDTIDEEKLSVLKEYGVNRISINPQTMKEETLEVIGRRHSVKDVFKAFEAANKVGFDVINADLISGLPGETAEDFWESLRTIMELGADNITLHTLAVKRASKLKELDENYNYRNASLCEEMLSVAHGMMAEGGYLPYYLYRQKHTSGNTENIGFCRENKLSLYNLRIMEEGESILALGAGGVSKIFFPRENRLERIANVSNYQIYIDRIDEMIERKREGFFFEK
ncbi:MAG: coproporphyrinogen dehydrogenase HemZ [Clostridiales bacterium]|nr:coproporphyrinogen dehydrogenase HemZ [Clostridiales bacterium]